MKAKKRIKQNIWGNWYGYLGRKRVIAFGNCAQSSAEDKAFEWKNDKS